MRKSDTLLVEHQQEKNKNNLKRAKLSFFSVLIHFPL